MENLYDYYIHYNIYTKEWKAFLRDEASSYMNDTNKESVVFSNNDINKLIEKICKND